jgi:hypothetical protein
MKRLVIAVALVAATTLIAFAEADDPSDAPPKPTLEEAQRLVQAISSDGAKLKAYCELDKLQGEMDKAEEANDKDTIDALLAKADALEDTLGPEFMKISDGLEGIEPNSPERRKFADVFATLAEKCK